MGLFSGRHTDEYFRRRLKEEDEAELRQKLAEIEEARKAPESIDEKTIAIIMAISVVLSIIYMLFFSPTFAIFRSLGDWFW